MKTERHIFKCVVGLGPAPICSLDDGSVFVSHHVPKLVDSLGLLMVSLTYLDGSILFFSFLFFFPVTSLW